MYRLGWGAVILVLIGCVHLRWRAPEAAPEIAAAVQFPGWGQDVTTTVAGPQLKALQIAMNDFLPLGVEPPHDADEWTRCMSRIENYDVWMRRGEGVTYLHFTPQGDVRCGLASYVYDAGASYAISDHGVILKRE